MKLKTFKGTDRQDRRRCGVRLLLLFLLLAGMCGNLQAQTRIGWTTSVPQMTPATLNVLSDTGYVDIDFAPLNAPLSNAKIEVQLPVNVTYHGTVSQTGHAAGIFTASSEGSASISGVKVSIGFNASSISANTRIQLQLKVVAGNCAFTSGNATIQVLSGSSTVTDGGGPHTLTINAQQPTIRMLVPTSSSSTASLTTPGGSEKANFALDIDLASGTAKGLKLSFTGDQFTFLENFKLDGNPVSAAPSGNNVWTLMLTDTIFSTTAKRLTFDAYSSRNSSRTITSAFQYPAGSNCVSGTGATFTLSYPPISDVPVINTVSVNWAMDTNIGTSAIASAYDIPMDGVTKSYVRVTYKNVGNASAQGFAVQFYPHRDIGALRNAYVVRDDIRYRINGSGELKSGRLFTSTSLTGYICSLKPENLYKPLNVTVYMDDVLLNANDEVTVYFPVVQGAIFDNTASTANFCTTNATDVQWVHYIFTGTDRNGVAIANGNNRSWYSGMGIYFPMFRATLPATTILPSASGQSTVSLYTGTLSNSTTLAKAQTLDIYVKLPAWLELDGDVTDALKLGSYAPISYTSDDGTKTYSIRVVESGVTENLTLKYKTIASHSFSINQLDSIRYWVNLNQGKQTSAVPDSYRPTLEHVSQFSQPLTFRVENEGVELTSFDFHRITRGLKDLNNNGIPDNNNLASDTEINMYKYLNYDQGQMIIKGKINGNTSGRDYFYLILNSGFYLNGMLGAASLAVEGGATINNITPTRITDYCFYLKANINGTLSANNEFTVTIPFSIGNTSYVPTSSLNAIVESYLSPGNLSGTAVTNPPTGTRFGKDLISKSISVAGSSLYDEYESAHSVNVSSNNAFSLSTSRYISKNTSDFTNEYRPWIYPFAYEVDIPSGYILGNDNKLTIRDELISDNQNLHLPPYSISTSASGITTYRYNLDSIFCKDYTELSSTLPTGQWRYKSGNAVYLFTATLRATKEASGTVPLVKRMEYKNVLNNTVTYSATRQLIYSASGLSLSTAATSLNAYGKRLTIPAISVGTFNMSVPATVWLYIDGNVSNISAKEGESEAIVGTGFENRWLNLGSLSPGTIPSYALSFDYNGGGSCSGDMITIYTVSDFGNSAWTFPTSSPIAPDYDHNGPKKQVSILVAEARINGSISVPSETKVIYEQPYTVTATLDASASPGILKNAQMIISIPAGQQYIEGSARLIYPTGTTAAVNSAVETALKNRNDNLAVNHSFTFNAGTALEDNDFSFDGYQTTPMDQTKQKVVLTAQFKPLCDTDIKGIRYSATLYGTNACGQNATDNGKTVYSNLIPTGISTAFAYTSAASLLGGNHSFGGNSVTGTLQVTVTKKYGTTQTYQRGKDYTEIHLPKWLVVDGQIQCTSDAESLTGDVPDTDTTHIDEGIRIELPINSLNILPDKGIEQPFTYSIPVRYIATGENDLVYHPEQIISSDVYTTTKFGDGCDEEYPFLLGESSELKIALLTLKTPNRYLYNMASIGKPFTVQVTSKDFNGGWYANENLSTELLLPGGATYIHPSRQTADTVMVYIKADFTQSYGKIPVTLRTPPADLVWRTTDTDENWLNPANWTTKMSEDEDNKAYLPALGTKVTLPSGADKYPVLTDTVACRIIRFEHGAELGRQDLLVYDSARVQLNITANQWYMFSPPLHQMYSGDFYREYPDPYEDRQTAYTVQFNITNPETSVYKSGEWTGAFSTPNIELTAGSGLAIWIDDGTLIDNHAALTFEFPKHDTKHHLYNPDRFPPGNISQTYAIERDKNGHFVYEGKLDASG
ncbi:MAG: hypothetical protein LBM08_07375, partial [Dysgonamonadaceae bacterium]|nr:hypothetical protein [Dysgonamonadaceae bacterium]